MPASRRFILLLFALVLMFFLTLPAVSWADTPEDAARQLAERRAASLPPGQTVSLNARNLSSLGATEFGSARRALEQQLRARGVRLAAAAAGRVEIRATLSENLLGLLWVAEFRRGDQPVVILVAAGSLAGVEKRSAAPSVFIRRQVVWEQTEPILDVALPQSAAGRPPRMVVLEPAQVLMYRSENEGWQTDQSFPLKRTRMPSRDLRGRLQLETDLIAVNFPGETCQVFLRPAGRIECQPVAGASPADVTSLAGEGEKKSPPWYSEARWEEKGHPIAVFAGTDGLARLYDDGPEPVAAFPGWGSDLAGLRTGCGTGWQLLVTGPGDWTEADSVQAYEIVNRQAVAVSPRVELPGPVMSLAPADELGTAVAAVRNLKSGRYEVYRLWVSCSQ